MTQSGRRVVYAHAPPSAPHDSSRLRRRARAARLRQDAARTAPARSELDPRPSAYDATNARAALPRGEPARAEDRTRLDVEERRRPTPWRWYCRPFVFGPEVTSSDRNAAPTTAPDEQERAEDRGRRRSTGRPAPWRGAPRWRSTRGRTRRAWSSEKNATVISGVAIRDCTKWKPSKTQHAGRAAAANNVEPQSARLANA